MVKGHLSHVHVESFVSCLIQYFIDHNEPISPLRYVKAKGITVNMFIFWYLWFAMHMTESGLGLSFLLALLRILIQNRAKLTMILGSYGMTLHPIMTSS